MAGDKRTYDAEDHKAAYESYYVSRNLSDVTRTLGLAYPTVLKWKAANYACKFGCPYHNWDGRIEEELRLMAAKEKVAKQGLDDPLSQEQAMQAALNGDPFLAPAPTQAEIQDAVQVMTTDRERLRQWQLLWAKLYFDITGIATDHATLTGLDSPMRKFFMEEVYKKGLKATNMEQAIRTLGYVQDKIVELERRLSGDEERTITLQAAPPPHIPAPDLSADSLRQLIADAQRRGNVQVMRNPEFQVDTSTEAV